MSTKLPSICEKEKNLCMRKINWKIACSFFHYLHFRCFFVINFCRFYFSLKKNIVLNLFFKLLKTIFFFLLFLQFDIVWIYFLKIFWTAKSKSAVNFFLHKLKIDQLFLSSVFWICQLKFGKLENYCLRFWFCGAKKIRGANLKTNTVLVWVFLIENSVYYFCWRKNQ